jgi:hypothetical protein
MRKNTPIILLIIVFFTSIAASAYESKTGLYFGIKSGMFTVDKVNALDVFSIGGIAGYNLPFKYKSFETALESEYNFGYFGGDHVSGTPGNRIHIRTLGGYGVIRFVNDNGIYTKGKIGVTHEVVLETISEVETPNSEIGPSFGVGFGYISTETVNLELEFTTTHSDMKFFNIGFYIKF